MNVSAWCIRNPIPAVMFFVMLTLAGLLGFQQMKIQQFPDIDLPTINITASLPGTAPAQMETEVARKIENAVASLQGVKNIYTKVQDGVAIVTVEFRLEKPTQEGLDDVRSAISRVRSDLPAELRDPVISKLDLAGAPILTYTVASTRMDDEALSWFVDNHVSKAMLAVRGVGSVARVGGVTREVRVELDPARLLALNASAADISRQLRNVQQDASGGRADVGGIEQSVRTIATVQSAAELGRLDINLADGRRIRLDQVARVTKSFTDAGVLVHAYLMYGFPTQTVQDTVDALEYVRQLFENGCIQSGFFHRFACTVHSPVGQNPDEYGVTLQALPPVSFAKNDVAFIDPTGVDHDAMGRALKKGIYNFMHGVGLDADVRSWFDVRVPKPTVSRSKIAQALS